MLFDDSRDARCYSDEATKEMITRYAVVVRDCISIISFLGRAYATRSSVMTERVRTVKDRL
jgi:hypothetical protein